MKTTIARSAALLGLAIGLSFAGAAQAASTWTFAGTGLTDANGEPLAKTTGYTGVDANLSISGVFAVNGTNNVAYAAGAKWQNPAPNGDTLYFGGGGLGMCSDPTNLSPTPSNPACAQPNHALDNNGNTEAILLSFSTSVILSYLDIGYKSGDADVSVFRYNGAGAPTLTSTGATKASMTGSGWELVGNYGDLNTTDPNANNYVNSSSLGSSWWLITAYNSSYGATSNAGAVNQGDDYFKLAAVTGTKCTSSVAGVCGAKVPEPGSLALASLAFAGLAYTRRRKTAK